MKLTEVGPALSDRAAAALPAPPGAVAGVAPFLFTVQVWGGLYTELLLAGLLPSLATPGNFGAFGAGSELLIHTTEADGATIRAAPIFATVAGMLQVRFAPIAASETADPHAQMSSCHRLAIAEAVRRGRPLVFLAPDTVMSEGALARLAILARAGVEAVVLPGIRVSAESFLPAFLGAHPARADGARPVAPADLVRLMLAHLHPASHACFWNSPDASTHPSHLYWEVNGRGLVGLCAHIHPILVQPRTPDAAFTTTIDGDYLLEAVTSFDRIHVVTDSDDMLVVELSSRTRKIAPTSGAPHDLSKVVRWMVRQANPLHRRFLLHSFLLHDGPVDAAWDEALRECAGLRAEIFARLVSGMHGLELDDPLALIERLSDLRQAGGAADVARVGAASGTSPVAASLRRLARGVTRRTIAVLYAIYRLDRVVATRYALGPNGPTRLHPAWISYRGLKRCIERRLPDCGGRLLVADGGLLRGWISDLARGRGYDVASIALRPGRGTDRTILEGAPLPVTEFDVVLCLDYLEFADDPAAALLQLAGTLRDGGQMLCASAFLSPRDDTAQDGTRFTTERIQRWLETDLTVTAIERIGGGPSLLAQVLLGWPRRALAAHWPGKVAIAFLCPAAIAWAIVVNTLLGALERFDGTRDFYSHSLLVARCSGRARPPP